MELVIKYAKTFEITGTRAIGRKLGGSFLSPFLWIGIIIVFFKKSGNKPSNIAMLIKSLKGKIIMSIICFSKKEDNPICPQKIQNMAEIGIFFKFGIKRIIRIEMRITICKSRNRIYKIMLKFIRGIFC